MRFWTRLLIVILVILTFSAIILTYLFYSEKLTSVESAVVKYGDVDEMVKMSGYVDSESTETIVSNTEGIIANLRVKEGGRAAKGMVLCDIRSPELREKLLGLKAELKTAEENLKQVISEPERKMAKARYDFIKANAADVAETIQPSSNINGDLIRVEVQNGDEVSRGNKLFFLADMTQSVVKARMDEIDVQKVRVGQPVWITGDFLSGINLQGKVSAISKYVERENETFIETTCKIFNPQKLPIKYGAYAEVRVVSARKKNVLLIPKEALIMDGKEYVFVIKDNRAYMTLVKVGIIGENYIEVISGLKAGDRVVTVGSLDLVDGSKIKSLDGI